jgi:hypothetical protein
MNSRSFLVRSVLKRKALPKLYLYGLLLAAGAGKEIQAQGLVASATLSGVSMGRGEYDYTLTLLNSPTSTAGIGMFWFGWEAGQADFLTSEPTSIQTPSAWNAIVEGGGAGDGYSVQFVTFTSPLAPGSSVAFTFESPDSPRVMAEPASLYPEYPTLTAQVYSGHAASGLQDVFLVQEVPEPGAWTLLGTGAVAIGLLRRKR